ncbi:DinB family protein [Flavihumibacter profundi]|uniref:DinB family protein n=1 Tax=Flavihumibacter profundi TaxID=2716883 RepID=UPI001CC6C259|nr:DinB family protein [Flavihumibacter profundi]MBZ5859493.1 DinB family protein [Flavihumibacter profundi]
MKPFNSSVLLRELSNESLVLLEDITQIAEQTSPDLLETNDGPGRWNTLQVLEHLNSYYRYYLPLMEHKMELSTKHAQPLFKPGWLGDYFTRSMLPKNGTISNKMKAVKSHSPNPKLNSSHVIGEFLQWQRKLVHLLHLAERCDLNAIRIPISISPFIKLKLGDVFRFIIAHNQRHQVQIGKLLNLVHPAGITRRELPAG